jgi:peptidyl-prolyl cis-trans isomerase SurA
MKKIIRSVTIALLAVFSQLAVVGTGAAEVVDRIVAVVNNDIITMSELNNMAKSLQAQAGMKPKGMDEKKVEREMLEALIDRKLAKAEAARRGLKVSDKEVTETLDRFKKSNNIPDDETMAKGLSQAGLSLPEFRQQIADQITQERLLAVVVGGKVSVSEADVRKLYEEKFKTGGSQVHLISLKLALPPGASSQQQNEARQKAEAIVTAIKRGESMAKAAEQFSLKPTDMGFISLGELDPRLAEYLGQIKLKDVAPVETPEGYQLIQLVDRRTGMARPFEEVAPEIRRILQQQEMGKYFSEWVKTLREKAHVKVML